ncbi:MAG: hypothetical protein L7W43_11155 [Rubripirellula sp.]|nr:hypothetical protein [Rubripirellula sp.]
MRPCLGTESVDQGCKNRVDRTRRIVAVDIQTHSIMAVFKDLSDPMARRVIDLEVDTLKKTRHQKAIIVEAVHMLDAQAVKKICEAVRGDREAAGLMKGRCRNAQART